MSAVASLPAFTFNEATHCYRDEHGMVVPSVTQILRSEGFINFDKVPPALLERKRRLGKLVHQATQLWDEGRDLNEFDIPSEVMQYVEGYFHFVEDTRFQPDLVEERSLAHLTGGRFGMTPDRRGEIAGQRTILELKSSASEHPAWGLQLALYDMGLSSKAQPVCARAALQLNPQFPRGYRLFPYDDPIDYRVALNALVNDIWKRNKKIAEYEEIPERLF